VIGCVCHGMRGRHSRERLQAWRNSMWLCVMFLMCVMFVMFLMWPCHTVCQCDMPAPYLPSKRQFDDAVRDVADDHVLDMAVSHSATWPCDAATLSFDAATCPSPVCTLPPPSYPHPLLLSTSNAHVTSPASVAATASEYTSAWGNQG